MGEPDGTLSLGASQRAPVASDVRPGDRVGRFVIDARLGEGGMGVVFAAHDPDLHRRVALKLLRAGAESPGYRSRLIREAQALARLHHPNVVSVHEIGADGDRVYVAMELVEGTTLTRWLASERRAWRDIVAMFLAVGEGVAAVHRAGLVHRDLKPDNVLVDRTGRARVADFGLARLASDDGEPSNSLAKLTQTGAVMGTPGYMAPEQQWGSDVDARADQYSFCVAMRAALATDPREASTALASTVNERGPRPKPVQHDWAGVPRRVRDVISRGLEYDASERYASMDELLAALREASRSRRGMVIVAAAATAVAGGVVALSIGMASGAGRPSAAGQGSEAVAVVQGSGSGSVAVTDTETGSGAAAGSGTGSAAGPAAGSGSVTRPVGGPVKPGGPGVITHAGSAAGSGSVAVSGSAAVLGSAAASGSGSGSGSAATAATRTVVVDASVLPIKDEAFGTFDPDNPEPPSGALLPPAGAEYGVDAQPPPPNLTVARAKTIRSIARQLGYHGLDTAQIDADPAGVEQRVRDYLAALPAEPAEDRWVAQIVLGLIIRYRGDCDGGPKETIAAAKLIDAAHPTYGDFRKLPKQLKRWYGRAWMANALCWLEDKNLDPNAFKQADKSLEPALVILGDLPASNAERGEQQLATAITMFERGDPAVAMNAWLEAAEKFGGSKVKKLAARWRAAAGL